MVRVLKTDDQNLKNIFKQFPKQQSKNAPFFPDLENPYCLWIHGTRIQWLWIHTIRTSLLWVFDFTAFCFRIDWFQCVLVSDCLISLCSGLGLFDFTVFWLRIVRFHCVLASNCLIRLCSILDFINVYMNTHI